jgi:hypothetical protein
MNVLDIDNDLKDLFLYSRGYKKHYVIDKNNVKQSAKDLAYLFLYGNFNNTEGYNEKSFKKSFLKCKGLSVVDPKIKEAYTYKSFKRMYYNEISKLYRIYYLLNVAYFKRILYYNLHLEHSVSDWDYWDQYIKVICIRYANRTNSFTKIDSSNFLLNTKSIMNELGNNNINEVKEKINVARVFNRRYLYTAYKNKKIKFLDLQEIMTLVRKNIDIPLDLSKETKIKLIQSLNRKTVYNWITQYEKT